MIAFPQRPPRGWPDGISPGFIELGAAPTSGAGFDCPPGSIAKVGTTYYRKYGSTATAWEAIAASPVATAQFRSDLYYAPAPNAQYSNGSATADLLWTVPVQFSRAGTITDIARTVLSGVANRRFMWGIYRGLAATPLLPGALAYSQEETAFGPGDHRAFHRTPNVTVSIGETVFFVTLGEGTLFDSANTNLVDGSLLPAVEGMSYTPVASSAPSAGSLIGAIGFKHALAYQSTLPDPFPATPTVMARTTLAIPIFLFKFTPS